MNHGHGRISILTAALLVLAFGLEPGVAQQEPLHGLQPVDQQVADHGPLSTSLRWVQYGLREPYNFSELYQLPIGQNDFVRRNAGLWAVFPRSLYISTDDGVYPSVPAGTVFYIGGPKDVIARIAEVQAPYVQVGVVDSDRVEESRIQAALLDSRVPASAIQQTMSTGRDLVTPQPRAEAQPPPGNGLMARSEWVASMPTLDFIHDEAYRRRCVQAAMASIVRTGHRVDTGQRAAQAQPGNPTSDADQP